MNLDIWPRYHIAHWQVTRFSVEHWLMAALIFLPKSGSRGLLDRLLSMVFAGQPNLMDKLNARLSAPLASRVIARTHLTGLIRDQMAEYLEHHLSVAGVKRMLFTDAAITAIHQGSGGLLRKANHLARGSLVAACIEKKDEVSAEHVRIASTELI